MRVFLAGATGVLGRRIVPLLVAGGHRVSGLARSAHSADRIRSLGADPVLGDALDADAVRTAIDAAKPDVVLHQLTDLSVRDTAANAALRVTGTRNLVAAALDASVRRIVVQSIAWAYQPGPAPAAEGTPLDVRADHPRRTTIDGVAVLESESTRLPEHVILRYGLLYGPDTWYAPDGAIADAARAGRLPANGDVVSFVHVDDAAAAAVEALAWPTGVVNVCDDAPAAGTEWVPEFCRAVGAPPPDVVAGRAGFARGADNTHARRALGWQPRWPRWPAGFAAMG